MAEVKSYTYEKRLLRYDILKGIKIYLSKWDIITICMGFFLAMAVPLPNVAPFGIAYLAQERRLRPKTVLLFLTTSLGSFIACGRLGGAKYIMAGIIYISCLFILKRGIKISDMTAALISGGAVLVSGIAMEFIRGITVLGIILLLCETAMTVSATLMMEKSIYAIGNKKIMLENLDGDTKLSICAVLLVALLGFQEIYIGSSLSVMLVIATVILLTISAGGGAEYSTGAGVVLGIVCGIGSDFFMPILGAFSFCGFLSGVFSKFGKGGVIAGVVLANAIMAVYTGSAIESVLSLYEVFVAAVIFGFVPSRWIDYVKQTFCLDDKDRENIMKIKLGIKSRLGLAAAAIENMAKSMNGFTAKDNLEQDISVIFDRTADNMCGKCRKSAICWGKGFDNTYDEMFKLLDVLKAKGVIKPEDITERLAANCSNVSGLAQELNHQFDLYRVHQVWRNKVAESRKLVGKQLGGMSEIIESLSNEIDKETGDSAASLYEIRSRLEMSGIKVKDINIFEDPYRRNRVEVTVKAANAQGKERRTIEKIVKSISGCSSMAKEDIPGSKRYVRLVFSAQERFLVETEHASRGVQDKNGDNFKMIHLKGGKFVIALSDGMGTGERAAKESQAILELINSFLEAGFDFKVAVKMINSIMIMRSEPDVFVTLDLCIIDLYTGEVRFIKTGAEPSFILNKGGRVRTVKTSSLPVGLLADAEAGVVTTKLQDGDKIVMLTDGVSMGESDNTWVDRFIQEKSDNGGEISKEILNRALEKSGDAVKDDMTVLTVSLKAVG